MTGESAPAAVERPSAPERTRRTRRVFPYLALLPAAVLVLGLMVLPIGATIWHSFTN